MLTCTAGNACDFPQCQRTLGMIEFISEREFWRGWKQVAIYSPVRRRPFFTLRSKRNFAVNPRLAPYSVDRPSGVSPRCITPLYTSLSIFTFPLQFSPPLPLNTRLNSSLRRMDHCQAVAGQAENSMYIPHVIPLFLPPLPPRDQGPPKIGGEVGCGVRTNLDPKLGEGRLRPNIF